MSDTGSQPLNSKYAWRELTCRGLPKRSASQRAADFLEIYGGYDESTAREQASRCIQCPNPTCVDGCPLCNPIPQWMQLTAEGRFLEAAAVLGSVTSMAEICTRLCPSDHLCEGACILESISEPVSIRALEQFLIDYAFAHGQVDARTAPPNGHKVAVVGSGPGGLVCAEELAKKGYAVTIFDAELVPGGLLVNGTPVFKLDHSIVLRRIELLQKRGVKLNLGVKLWKDVTLSDLRSKFEAVYLGFDWRKARLLEMPGAELNGVVPAPTFLLEKRTAVQLDMPAVDLQDQVVVVIGAGDTAMDCLRTAIRYGARKAVCVYRRDEADMPCSRLDYQNALEEGAEFVFCASPIAVLGDTRGRVTGLRMLHTELGPPEGSGPRPFLVQRANEFVLEANWIVPALGFEPLPCPGTADFEGLTFNRWGGIVVDLNQMTSIPGVFAGGDIVRGPSVILRTVRDARVAAAGMDAYVSAEARKQPGR